MRIISSSLWATATLISTLYASRAVATGEAQHAREYFYIGGEYITTPTGTLFQNQMYVEKLTPARISQAYPIVFVHGGGQTGTNFLNKPDGGRGWASWFLEKGYQVYIVDEPTRGRSPWNPASGFPQSTFTAEFVEQRFTDVQDLSSTLWPQAKLHTQWPGASHNPTLATFYQLNFSQTGLQGDPIFDAYYQTVVQFIANGTEQERSMKEAGIALLDKIGPSVLITHSQGGLYGWALADARPSKVKALIQIEPKGPPFKEVIFSTDFSRPYGLTSIPLSYSPAISNPLAPLATQLVPSTSTNQTSCLIQAEPARKLPNLAKVPILVETGEASYHAMYDYCFILFLKQAGVKAEHLELGKAGIHGNAHLQFLEKNSDAIAAKLEAWIRKAIKA